jgi:hypothetical protein
MTQVVLDKQAIGIARSVAFFETVEQAYQKAAQNFGDQHSQYFDIADHLICLQFVGSALTQRMTRAIAHLEVPIEVIPDGTVPDLTICLMSERETGCARPAAVWEDYQYQRRGEIRGFVNERIYTAMQWGSEALVILDKLRNLVFYWVEDHNLIPYWESGAPFQSIFNVWLGERNV